MFLNRLTFGAAVLLGALLAPAGPAHAETAALHVAELPPLVPGDRLVAASASGPDDIWAVGQQAIHNVPTPIPGDSGPITLEFSSPATLHRTASGWQHQNPPWLTPNKTEMIDVSAATPKDVWVTGRNKGNSFVQHWNGSSWTDRTMRLGITSSLLVDTVEAVPGGTAWALGYGPDNAYHWTGSAWERTPFGGTAREVVARSADDAWALGVAGSYGALWHWDGSSWTRPESPLDDLRHTVAPAAAFGPAGDLWVVSTAAWSFDLKPKPTYLMRFDGGKWTSVRLPDSFASVHMAVDGGNTPWLLDGSGKIFRWDGTDLQPVAVPAEPKGMRIRSITAIPGTTTIWGFGDRFRGPHYRTDFSSVALTSG